MGICRYCALAPAACGRELTDLPLFPPPHFFSHSFGTSDCAPSRSRLRSLGISVPVARSPQRRTRKPAAGPCVISGAIPYSVPTMICSRLVPRSRWISFIGVRVCPTSIYRRGVPCTGYSQHHKKDFRGATSPWAEALRAYVESFSRSPGVGKSSV